MFEVTYYIQERRFRVYCCRFDDVINLLVSRYKAIDWKEHYVSVKFVEKFDVEENV